MKRIFLIMVSLWLANSSEARENDLDRILSLLKSVKPEELSPTYNDAVAYGLSLLLDSDRDDHEFAIAAFGLWTLRNKNALYTCWWEKRSRLHRLLLLALLFGEGREELDNLEGKLVNYSRRFAPTEAKERLAELKCLREHRATLARAIAEVLVPVVGRERSAGYIMVGSATEKKARER